MARDRTDQQGLPWLQGSSRADEIARPAPEPPPVLGVAELDRRLKRMLEASTAEVRVRGEVTGLHRAASRHVYFSLRDRDEDALIECVMYRTAPARARDALRDGESVVLVGRVTLFAPRGRMQLVADDLVETGRGALLEALEKLKAKLTAEGLFAAERKRALPAAPRCIAVLTSRDGAAIHDVVRVAFRRGRVRLLLVPTPVQGAGAPEKIAEAIALADRLPSVDVILVTRGGGSAEDLAAYDDERVVRAVAAAEKPVVSAVGHEVDVSLCDLAADARAATPSQAAELLVPDDSERRATLEHWRRRLARAMGHSVAVRRRQLAELRAGLGEPRRLVLEQSQRFDELLGRLERAERRRLGRARAEAEALRRRLEARHPQRVLGRSRTKLEALVPRLGAAIRRRCASSAKELALAAARLEALSPLAVLARGYAIATDERGRAIRSAAEVTTNDRVRLRLHEGRLVTRVEERELDAGSGQRDGA